MDLPWGDERTRQFVTNVGLITTNGPYGHDIMAAEWTHHISYKPGLIAICINPRDATHANIEEAKEFGVSLCAYDQNVLSSISGGSSGKNTDKISAMKELGFKFYKAKKINVLMIEGAALNIECKLVKQISLGDHTTFVGETVETKLSDKKPLVYHAQKYWNLGGSIAKPSQNELDRISRIIEKHKKK